MDLLAALNLQLNLGHPRGARNDPVRWRNGDVHCYLLASDVLSETCYRPSCSDWRSDGPYGSYE